MTTITQKLSADDLLMQLAEEAAKLVQAATKYYRVVHGVNPSPKSREDARSMLIKEIADVDIAADALRCRLGIGCDEIAEVEAANIEHMNREELHNVQNEIGNYYER